MSRLRRDHQSWPSTLERRVRARRRVARRVRPGTPAELLRTVGADEVTVARLARPR